jgi:hypothetical protein
VWGVGTVPRDPWRQNKPMPEDGVPGKCNAKRRSQSSKATGKRLCRLDSGYGTSHPGVGRCKYHGGSTPGHVLNAQKLMLEKAVQTYGLPVVGITPEEALLGELERTAGAVRWIGDRIAQMEPEALVWGRHQAKQLGLRRMADEHEELVAAMGPDLYEITLQAGISAWLELYLRERAHLTKIAAVAIKAGLEERKISLAERQGAQLRTVLAAVFSELQLTDAQMRRVPEVMANVLDRFTGGGFGGGQVISGQAVEHRPIGA